MSTALAEPALTVGSTTMSDGEVRAYAWSAGESYRETAEYYQQNLHIDYWSLQYPNGMSIEDTIRSDVFRQLVTICVLCDKAGESSLKLSESDLARCDDEADAWFTQLDSPAFTQDDVESLYEKQLLANRQYGMMVLATEIDEEAVSETISPEDWLTYNVSYIYTMADDESLHETMLTSENFGLTASANTLLSAGTLELGPDSSEELLTAARRLDIGETSDLICTSYGYFVIRLTSTSDEAFEDVYYKALYQAREEAFEPEYEALYASAEYTIYDSFRSALVLR